MWWGETQVHPSERMLEDQGGRGGLPDVFYLLMAPWPVREQTETLPEMPEKENFDLSCVLRTPPYMIGTVKIRLDSV